MIEIEKAVPIPNRKGSYEPRESKYPYKAMEVGDSFLVVEPPKSFRQQVNNWGKFTDGKKFCYRTTPEGVRVWRVR